MDGIIVSEKNPLKLLQRSINRLILVKLKNGHEFKGLLDELDSYMNIVMKKAEEIVEAEIVNEYPRIFIRGNNILFIKPDISPKYPKTKT